jgi:hypothetical protein
VCQPQRALACVRTRDRACLRRRVRTGLFVSPVPFSVSGSLSWLHLGSTVVPAAFFVGRMQFVSVPTAARAGMRADARSSLPPTTRPYGAVRFTCSFFCVMLVAVITSGFDGRPGGFLCWTNAGRKCANRSARLHARACAIELASDDASVRGCSFHLFLFLCLACCRGNIGARRSCRRLSSLDECSL